MLSAPAFFGGFAMKLPLSDRLLACCGFVHSGDRVADIGCDHGYLGIHLLQSGVASHVYAADVREGPLSSAKRNAELYGMTGKMDFFLSDGVQGIPRDFDTLVCAGMGADTMISILSVASWLQSRKYRLILQCQSKTPSLRRYLSETGWHISEESVLRDGRFLYTVMEVLWQPDAPKLTVGQWYFPPALLQHPSPQTAEYYRWVIDGLRIAAEHRPDGENRQALTELEPLQEELL